MSSKRILLLIICLKTGKMRRFLRRKLKKLSEIDDVKFTAYTDRCRVVLEKFYVDKLSYENRIIFELCEELRNLNKISLAPYLQRKLDRGDKVP